MVSLQCHWVPVPLGGPTVGVVVVTVVVTVVVVGVVVQVGVGGETVTSDLITQAPRGPPSPHWQPECSPHVCPFPSESESIPERHRLCRARLRKQYGVHERDMSPQLHCCFRQSELKALFWPTGGPGGCDSEGHGESQCQRFCST